MLGYYVKLALRGFGRDAVLTTLVIIATGIGIGMAATTLTILRAMSAQPIPQKASRLFAVELDNWGPAASQNALNRDQLSYADAAALLDARRAQRQTAMYALSFVASRQGTEVRPVLATARAVGADFFAMFQAPFRAGAPWSAADDAGAVVVLGAQLAQRLFPAGDALGRTVELDRRDYRVVGVLAPWHLQPRVYDLTSRLYQPTEDVFLPLATAIDRQMMSYGSIYCQRPPAPGWNAWLHSECRWLQFWVELPDAAAVRGYRDFLRNYALEQRRDGRFDWPPSFGLYDQRAWLARENMVPESLRISSLLAFGFLAVCLVNAVGLLLAKFRSRGRELDIRRAVGASRRQVFCQCLMEAALVGMAGAIPGLLLAALGLTVERALVREDYAVFTHFDAAAALLTVALAVLAALCAGVYPAWRASRPRSAWRLGSAT